MSEKDSSKRIRLTVEGGPTREFSGDRAFVIGRSQNADFSIPHPNLSREHVRISLKGEDVWLEDLGSANGTFVQGQRLPSKSTVKIKPHYRVLLGSGSDVMIAFEVVEYESTNIATKPRGDLDLSAAPIARTTTSLRVPLTALDPVPSPSEKIEESFPSESERSRMLPPREATRTSMTRAKSSKLELDYPSNHFPHEVKKEKFAELRIIEAKKQRVLEDIQYKEREVNDLRSKIRDLREESIHFKQELEEFKSQVQPLTDQKAELEQRLEELELIYQEKIDTLESGFIDLKGMLEESHAGRMADAERDYKNKSRRLEEDYAEKLQILDTETRQLRFEGEKLRDRLAEEKKTYEEALKKIQGESASMEAEHRLSKVRVETELAQLQGAKMKLENELENIRRDKEKLHSELNSTTDLLGSEKTRLEEARINIEKARTEEASFRRAIEEAKQSEETNIRRIEELRSQVSMLEGKASGIELSLKQAELDADAIRREGQKAADQYRTSVQVQIEDERAAMRKNIETEMQSRLSAAERNANEILEQARTQASEIEGAAREVADRVSIDANAQIEKITLDARTRAEELTREAAIQAERVTQESNTNAERVLSDANVRFQQVTAEATAIAERATADANAYVERVTVDANARVEKVTIETNARIERVTLEANAQLMANRKTLENELLETRKKADQEVRQLRTSALNEIESTRERETKEFENRLKSRAKEIGGQIERIVGSKLVGQFGVTMDPVTLKEFSDDIHQVVGNVIGNAKGSATQSETTLKTVLTVNSKAQDRAVLYWKKMGAAAAIVFVLILGRVVAPGFYSKIGDKIGNAMAVKDNTDAVVKRMLRERQLAMTFVTEQDRHFRDNYTDNLLYVEGFIDMKDDVESQKSWTLQLNKFFQNELGLTEKAIVQFGSAEGRMMRELIELRKNITPVNSEAGIAKMRNLESPFLKEMKFIVRTDSNWKRFEVYHREFYQSYIQSLGRSPAATTPAQ